MSEDEIVIASGNKGKIREAQEILSEFKIIPLSEVSDDIDVEEDKDTFEGNAIKKATEISKHLNGKKCISDDTGMEIEYLNGFPGVYTKRWHKGSDRDRNLEIVNKLKGVSKENRKVKCITAIALAEGEKVITAVTILDGYIAEAPRGEYGFGFDEIFELENGKTLAELSMHEKNEISARRKALEIIREKLEKDSLN